MFFAGELHCICCGYVAGDIDGDDGKSFWEARLTPARNGPGFNQQPGERPRCGRCGGRLIIQDRDEYIRVAAVTPVSDAPKARKLRRSEEAAVQGIAS